MQLCVCERPLQMPRCKALGFLCCLLMPIWSCRHVMCTCHSAMRDMLCQLAGLSDLLKVQGMQRDGRAWWNPPCHICEDHRLSFMHRDEPTKTNPRAFDQDMASRHGHACNVGRSSHHYYKCCGLRATSHKHNESSPCNS